MASYAQRYSLSATVIGHSRWSQSSTTVIGHPGTSAFNLRCGTLTKVIATQGYSLLPVAVVIDIFAVLR